MRVTWKKQPNESGLATIAQSPRGRILSINGKEIFLVKLDCYNSGRYYYSGSNEELGIPSYNSLWDNISFANEGEAMTHAKARAISQAKPPRPDKAKLKAYCGYDRIPGRGYCSTVVIAPTKKRAVELLSLFGGTMSMSHFNNHWTASENESALALSEQGEGVYYSEKDNSEYNKLHLGV